MTTVMEGMMTRGRHRGDCDHGHGGDSDLRVDLRLGKDGDHWVMVTVGDSYPTNPRPGGDGDRGGMVIIVGW